MAKRYRYTVQGGGTFPVDMLRYDSCYPCDTESALNMLSDTGLRKVVVMSSEAPTVARWASFLWDVSKIERV